MSLGGDAHGVEDLLTNAVDNLDKAGIVVAVSAGNDGPGHYTVGSPGSAERALTAGASSVGHYIAVPVDGRRRDDHTPPPRGDFPVPRPSPAHRAASRRGRPAPPASIGLGLVPQGAYARRRRSPSKIALVSRGDCTFAQQGRVSPRRPERSVSSSCNNAAGDPTAMAGDPHPDDQAGRHGRAGTTRRSWSTRRRGPWRTTITTAEGSTPDSANGNIMGDFSSQGPTDVDYRVKPDLVAPGVNVLSSIPNNETYCDATSNTNGCWAFFNGTSMASPHLAGTAAVVTAAHPGWSGRAGPLRDHEHRPAGRPRSTAKTSARRRPTRSITGAGLDDVLAAVGAKVALSSVSTSFGAVPVGQRQGDQQERSRSPTCPAPPRH